tara:strand:- start:27536 stop:28162 length:627 start_codon:yes stop_codon:yes gene_type:complete
MVFATSRVRRTSAYHARRRRLSLLSDAELARTLELAVGSTADLGQLGRPDLPVTFEAVVDRDGAAVGPILTAGKMGLTNTVAGITFSFTGFPDKLIAISPGRRYRYNLAYRPGDAQARLWIDSDCVMALELGTVPLDWHTGSGSMSGGTLAAGVVSPLSTYQCQRPRHFGDAREVAAPVEEDSILCRAAIATHLATSAYPFTDCVVTP